MTRTLAAHREATDVERVFREVYGQAVANLVRVFGDKNRRPPLNFYEKRDILRIRRRLCLSKT